ncbi:MAG: FKBP-type peptidyl-prolyl cis-trans isomerase [Bacteroidales bacterium]|nr:FKBP-type peptidyl-prolyl cis-trans isomerase [Bacteroidales bacterium]
MKMRNIYACLLFVLLLVMDSCSIETYSTIKQDANREVLSYIVDNELNVEPNASGLVYIEIQEGEGDSPKIGDKVAFHYKGYFFNGEVFDSSYDKPYPLIVELGNDVIIKGLEEALMLMNKGSKAKVIVPFYLAYGDMENAPVPPFSNLVFELEMIDFK